MKIPQACKYHKRQMQGCHLPGKPGKSENLKETSESQGICLKSQGICDRIPKVRESQGILLSEIHFQPS